MNDQTAPSSFWGTDTLPTVDYGRGCYVYDKNGKAYIDGSGGPSTYCIGHGNTEVNDAIKGQLDRIATGYRYSFNSEPLESLQATIARRCGGGLRHSVIVCGGSEAVESCLKIALQYQSAIGEPTRRRFIARQRSWHGNTLGALAVSGFAERRAPFEGALVEANFVSAANAYRPPTGIAPENIAQFCADELEREILKVGPQRVCAFIFEPVVGAAGGAVPAPADYARRVREVCDRHGVLMIADEVMCGVGRTGSWRALAHDAVEPDLMSIAKGLGAGYLPLGAAVYHDRVAIAIRDSYGRAANRPYVRRPHHRVRGRSSGATHHRARWVGGEGGFGGALVDGYVARRARPASTRRRRSGSRILHRCRVRRGPRNQATVRTFRGRVPAHSRPGLREWSDLLSGGRQRRWGAR